MTPKFRGSDTPSGDVWITQGDVLPLGSDYGSVWFSSETHPGLRAVVTVRLDGRVVGFELQAEGTMRAYPDLAGGVELIRAFPEGMPPIAETSIGARQVRSVPLGDLASRARVILRQRAEERAEYGTSVIAPTSADPRLEEQLLALRADPRPGRRGRPDIYYARLAVAYERWLDSGEKLEALAGRIHMSTSGLRAALHTARNKGLLSDAPAGRAGGFATDKARTLADESD